VLAVAVCGCVGRDSLWLAGVVRRAVGTCVGFCRGRVEMLVGDGF